MCHNTVAQLYFKFLLKTQHEVPFINASEATKRSSQRSNYRNACVKIFWRTNLVPRAHVSFGQRQDTELWNNPIQETKILGLPVSRRMRALVEIIVFNCKVDVNAYWMPLWNESTSILPQDAFFKLKYACAVKLEVPKSWSLEMDYSRAPCLGADQRTRGLWERDCWRTKYNTMGTYVIQWDVNKWPCILTEQGTANAQMSRTVEG